MDRSSIRGSSSPYVIEWQPKSLSIPAGTWTLRWQVSGSSSAAAWLSDVSFTPGSAECWFETPRPWFDNYLLLPLDAPPGETYDVEGSADLVHWLRVQRLTFTDFQYTLDVQSTSPAQFYRLHKSILAPLWLERLSIDANKTVLTAVHSEPGQPLVLESSTDLSTWETLLQTNNSQGILSFSDALRADSSQRFYRAKALPWGVRPVPAFLPFNQFPNRRHPYPPGFPVPVWPGY